jgi:ParB/RepB/Spo0J family partition protein
MKVYDTLKEIRLDYIEPDLDQPRKTFRRDTLAELAESIKTSGLINPILVEKKDKNSYKIVVGHRRYEACRIAGISKARCQIVEDLTAEQRLEIQIIEDSQEPIPVWESAEGIVKLYQKLDQRRIRKGEKKPYSLKMYSSRIGKGEIAIRRAFRYVNLSSAVKQMVHDGYIKYEIASEIGRIDDAKKQEREALKAAREEYSLKQTKIHIDNMLKPENNDEFFLMPDAVESNYDKELRAEFYQYLNPAIRALKTVYEISLLEDTVRQLMKRKDIIEKFSSFIGTFKTIEDAVNKESKYLHTLEQRPPKEMTLKERIFIGKQKQVEAAGEKFVARHNYSNEIIWLGFDQIQEDPENIRKTFDKASLEELADSVRNVGLIHPVLVEKLNGKYKIVVGHRRSRAAKIAGCKKIRCIEISTLSSDERLEFQIAEDSQEPFSLDERAESWRRLYTVEQRKAEQKGEEYTFSDFSRKLGKNPSTVRKAFAFIMLDDKVKALVRENIIKYGVGVELSHIKDADDQYWSALRSAVKNMTVCQVKQYISQTEDTERYYLPDQWKQSLEEFSKNQTLAAIVRELSIIVDSKNAVITQKLNLKDAKVRKKVIGWRRVIRKFYDLRKVSRKIEEKYYR